MKKNKQELVYDKPLPQAIPIEEAVLGALMLDKDAIAVVKDVLHPESFFSNAHQAIYKAILFLFERSQPCDLLTVTEQLKINNQLDIIGGPYYLVGLTNRVASAANVEYHAKIITEKYIRRELIRVSERIVLSGYREPVDVFSLLQEAEDGLFNITQKNLSRSVLPLSTLMPKALRQLEIIAKRKTELTGVPSGFTDLDRMTSGWQPADLIIMAARPGMGKTGATLCMARSAAKEFGKGVAFFSLEMSSIQLVNRLISIEAEIAGSKLRSGELEDYEWQQLALTIEEIKKWPLYIDDTPGINILELRAKCRRLKMQHDIQMVIVDYLQLMTGIGDAKGNREQEVSSISRGLKGLAKELNVPVIALSQLSRAVETRGGMKRPQLSDLRESGSIEQDSDIVSFIYRPEYYQILEDEEGQSLKGIGEIIIAKHRNGALGTVKLKFIDKYAKFTELDDWKGFRQLPEIKKDTEPIVDTSDQIIHLRPTAEQLDSHF